MWALGVAWAGTRFGNAVDLDRQPVELVADDGRWVSVGPPSGAPLDVDLGGATVLPGFVDSHVHLSFAPEAARMAAGGVLAAVDLAAPVGDLGRPSPLELLRSGPMITAPGGYPTTSWGRDGYGWTCDGAAACTEAVDRLIAAGAAVIKVPVDGTPALDDATLAAVVTRAHAAGRKVVAHALSDAGAARAAAAGADALAHAPVEPLADATVAAWGGRAVIGTLTAFGGASVDNLRRLRAAGATVLYGTDFGNTRVAGIAVAELAAMEAAGMSRGEVIRAATVIPAEYWGLEVGRMVPGGPASFIVVDGDPMKDLSVLERCVVWERGRRR